MQKALALLEDDDLAAFERQLRELPELVTARGDDRDTLLHWAAHRKSAPAVDLLLRLGADANARGFNGRTPLHAAVNDTSAERALPVVRLLLARGAKPSIRNDAGYDALAWAKQEVWEPNDELLALLGGEPGSIAEQAPASPDDYAATVARVRSIEMQGHTELDAFRLLRAFISGEKASVDDSMPRESASDRHALEELSGLLAALERTRWKEPVKRLLAEHLRPADVRALVALYFEASRSQR